MVVDGMGAGRPLKFQSAEELHEKVQAYFDECDNRTDTVLTKTGDLVKIPNPRPYTISGLAFHLGTNRATLLNYEEREEHSEIIKDAKARIEAFVEESLWTPKVAAGVIFNLKNNYGWVDKQEIDQNSKVDAAITVRMEGELEEWSK